MAILASVLGAFFILVLVVIVAYNKDSSKKEQAKNRQIAMVEGDLLPNQPEIANLSRVWKAAQSFVKEKLIFPESAKFVEVHPEELSKYIQPFGDDAYLIGGWVKSKNAYGENLQNKFICVLQELPAGRWKCPGVAFNEEIDQIQRQVDQYRKQQIQPAVSEVQCRVVNITGQTATVEWGSRISNTTSATQTFFAVCSFRDTSGGMIESDITTTPVLSPGEICLVKKQIFLDVSIVNRITDILVVPMTRDEIAQLMR